MAMVRGGYPPSNRVQPQMQYQASDPLPGGMPPGAMSTGAMPTGAMPARTSEAPEPPVHLDLRDLPMEPADGFDVPHSYMPSDTTGLKDYEGYNGVGFQPGQYLPPPPTPSYSDVMASGSEDNMEFNQTDDLSEAEAREALLEYVNSKTCFGKGATEKMDMTAITPCNALHYVLETFCEGRTLARSEVPYLGGEVDGSQFGAPPMPWDIPCEPSDHFQDQMYNIPVPHTAEVRICLICNGSKIILCPTCCGSAWVKCRRCRGSRTTGSGDRRRTCAWCRGRGKNQCQMCHNGIITCPHCAGKGQVVNYIQLTVAFMNYKKDYILVQTEMPDELIRTVEGEQVFQQTQLQVNPLTAFPVKDLKDNSNRLIEAEKTMHPEERQKSQRQTIRVVPVTQIDYKFKDTVSKFFVYGNERKVYSPDYPQQCCWGCNIL